MIIIEIISVELFDAKIDQIYLEYLIYNILARSQRDNTV